MDNKRILNKEVNINTDQNTVIIVEEIETNLNSNQLRLLLKDIDRQKNKLSYDNKRIVEEYNRLLIEEEELLGYLNSIDDKSGTEIEVI